MEINCIELNEEDLEKKLQYKKSEGQNALKDGLHYLKKYYIPNKSNVIRFLLGLFHVLEWLPKYRFKDYFLRDLLGGVTLGIVLIPQTMGYSINGVIKIIAYLKLVLLENYFKLCNFRLKNNIFLLLN